MATEMDVALCIAEATNCGYGSQRTGEPWRRVLCDDKEAGLSDRELFSECDCRKAAKAVLEFMSRPQR